MAWPTGCDQFWSDLNAGCSDEFGNYITPPGGGSAVVNVIGGQNPVLPSIVTRSPQAPIVTGSVMTASRPLVAGMSNTNLFLIAAGVLGAVVLWKR